MFGRKRLQRENAFLREQLGWYADSANWRRKGVNATGEPRKWLKSPAAFDRGARAKFALTQVTEPSRAAWSVPIVSQSSPGPSARIDTSDTE